MEQKNHGGMFMLPRTQYVNELIRLKDNGRVKIITGLRRSGKSVFLFELYREHLLSAGMQNPYVDDREAKITFVDVVLGLMKIKNADIYVTGSNSKMLSSA